MKQMIETYIHVHVEWKFLLALDKKYMHLLSMPGMAFLRVCTS